MRLGTWMPFPVAARECAWFTGVASSPATARRHTEAAGAAQVACQTAAVAELERTTPTPPAGAPVQQLSADGAMVPLVGGTWAEVKTVARVRPRGAVEVVEQADGTRAVQTRDWSSFSRLADAETFTREALVERHRRGTATAKQVVAVMDGSTWLQHFTDAHRPDAVRVLDFPHAAEHVSAAARAVWGEGTEPTKQWLDRWLSDLKQGSAADVLAALCQLPVATAAHPRAAGATQAATLEYLASRWEQIQYAAFREQGYPIGSGSVESGNKLIVEARLKGSGMHWARAQVNPMLALRNLACNDRWAEGWPVIEARLRADRRQRGCDRRQRRAAGRAAAAATAEAGEEERREDAPVAAPLAVAPPVAAERPRRRHPWRQPLLRGGREWATNHAKT